MKETISCTIIIVIYNCWDYVGLCLAALARQSFTDFEVTIVDNGESSQTQIDSLANYPFASYFKSTHNLGFALGNNWGISQSQSGEWIVFLNPDTVPADDWLEKLMLAAKNYPECLIFGANLIQHHSQDLSDGDGDCYHVSGLAWRNGMGKPVKHRTVPYEIFSPCAAAAMYKREVIETINGFDEDFFCYMEDVDLGFRSRLAGYHAMNVPDALVTHVGSVTTGKRSDFYVYHGQRNLIWVYVKNMPGILFWLFLPGHVLLNLLAVLRYGFNGKFKVLMRAKYDALKSIKTIWHKRQLIQKQRKASVLDIFRVLNKHLIPGMGRAVSSFWK